MLSFDSLPPWSIRDLVLLLHGFVDVTSVTLFNAGSMGFKHWLHGGFMQIVLIMSDEM